MSCVDFFRLQAKLLFKDYKTKFSYVDDVGGGTYYRYSPKHFDIDGIFAAYDLDEDDFSLMKAQHLIALMFGFGQWADLLKASPAELELAKLTFDYKVDFEEWKMYIAGAERDNRESFDAESKLEIFKKVFVEGRAFELYQDPYRLGPIAG